MFIAVIHTVFGAIAFQASFATVFRFDSVRLGTSSAVTTAFWFFVSGAFALMMGGLVSHLERRHVALPPFLPWSLLVLTTAGCALMPVSAWWLLIVPAAGMFVRMQHEAIASKE